MPGGRLYLVEIHPITDIFDKDGLTVEHHYFDHGAPSRDETPGTYADERADPRNNLTCQWTHTLDAVLSSLLGAGLTIESFSEHDGTVFRQFGNLESDPTDRTFRFPPGHPRLPLMYSLRVVKRNRAYPTERDVHGGSSRSISTSSNRTRSSRVVAQESFEPPKNVLT